VGHLFHFGVIGFKKHLVGAGEVFFNLLEFAVLGDDFAELGLLLGDFWKREESETISRRGKFLGELVVASAELVQFFSERESGHCKTSVVLVVSSKFLVKERKKVEFSCRRVRAPEGERKAGQLIEVAYIDLLCIKNNADSRFLQTRAAQFPISALYVQ